MAKETAEKRRADVAMTKAITSEGYPCRQWTVVSRQW
jgi:hypothetical protein